MAHSVGEAVLLVQHDLALFRRVRVLTAMDMVIKLALLFCDRRRRGRILGLV